MQEYEPKDGTKKMSKSEESDLSRINLTDSKDQIMQKVKKAKTDSEPINEGILALDTKRYEAQNLIKIYASLKSESPEKTIKNFDGKSFSDFFKNNLAELLVEKISPISDKIKEYKNDKEQLKKILKNGNKQASDTANKTIIEVKKL